MNRDFNGSIERLAEKARRGDDLAREELQRELEQFLSPMIRRWLRTRKNSTPLERQITRLFAVLTSQGEIAAALDDRQIVSLLAARIGRTIVRRLSRGNVVIDTVADRPNASVCTP